MSFADSLQFPTELTVIPPARNQSIYTRNFAFSGTYDGYLSGALIMYPKQSTGAAIFALVQQPTWYNPAQRPGIFDYLRDYAIGTWDWSNLSMDKTYIPVLQGTRYNCAVGTVNIEWANSAWEPDARIASVEYQPVFGQITSPPFTVASRTIAMWGSVVRNTISTTNVAVSGTCNAFRAEEIEIRATRSQLTSQYAKSYASPDKDYAAIVPLQNGVMSISGADFGIEYAASNPWQTQTSQVSQTSYQTVGLQDGNAINLPTFEWSNVSKIATGDYTNQVNFGTEAFSPGATGRALNLLLSPYVTPSAEDGESRWAMRCPAPNMFDTPTVTLKWQFHVQEGEADINTGFAVFKLVHFWANVNQGGAANLPEELMNVPIFEAQTKVEWLNTSVEGGQTLMTTTFPKTAADGLPFGGRPRRGVWLGCMIWAFASKATVTDPRSLVAAINDVSLGYDHMLDNPVHVCSWEGTQVNALASARRDGPISIDGNVVAEAQYSNEARTYASASNFPRSLRADDALEAANSFLIQQERKTAYDKVQYEKMAGTFREALRR